MAPGLLFQLRLYTQLYINLLSQLLKLSHPLAKVVVLEVRASVWIVVFFLLLAFVDSLKVVRVNVFNVGVLF